MYSLLLPCCLALALPASQEESPVQEATYTQAELEALSARIQVDVERLRGLEFKRPVKVELANRKDFFGYAQDRMERTGEFERVAGAEMMAKLLGLLPGDMDYLATTMAVLEEQVGGFYDPNTESFYLMEGFTGPIAEVILAHELTHALDDQHYDIDGTLKKLGHDSDRILAYHAVVEGSGTALMQAWTVEQIKNKHFSMADLAAVGDLGTAGLEDAPPYIWKPLLGSYMRGESFLRRAGAGMNIMGKTADMNDVNAAFANPPRSLEQVLHPKKYWEEKSLDEPLEVTVASTGLENGWVELASDRFGELMLSILTTPIEERTGLDASNPMAVMGVKYTNDAASGWRGDRVVLVGKDEARALRMWTYWETERDAAEFKASIEAVAEATRGNLSLIQPREGERGFAVGPGRYENSVVVNSWVGVSPLEAMAALDSLTVNVPTEQ